MGLARQAHGRLEGSGLVFLACLITAVITVVLMAQAARSGQLFGLYQRLNYGVSVIWIAGLALTSLRPTLANRIRIATT